MQLLMKTGLSLVTFQTHRQLERKRSSIWSSFSLGLRSAGLIFCSAHSIDQLHSNCSLLIVFIANTSGLFEMPCLAFTNCFGRMLIDGGVSFVIIFLVRFQDTKPDKALLQKAATRNSRRNRICAFSSMQ